MRSWDWLDEEIKQYGRSSRAEGAERGRTTGDRVTLDGRAEVLILARGGGAIEDLSCFNSEIVVRAIAECPIPVVTGIGHERDESLADLAADVCAATPTTAAAIVIPDLEDLVDEHLNRIDRVRATMQRVLIDRQYQLNQLRIRCDRIKKLKVES